jgi:predicted glycogen debranching enzyme
VRQITFSGTQACDRKRSACLEWLLTNGLGGFASGTVAGINTRRYHGLLVAAPGGPDRYLLLAQLHEQIQVAGKSTHLGAFLYRDDTIHPRGFEHLWRFCLYPYPTWLYASDSWMLKKRIIMNHGHNTVMIGYRLLSSPSTARLVLQPFVAGRHYHATQRCHQACFTVEGHTSPWICVRGHEGVPSLWLASCGKFVPRDMWYHNVIYTEEAARGLDYEEDLFVPGEFSVDLTVGDDIWFVASTEPTDIPPSLSEECGNMTPRQAGMLKQAGGPTGTVANLVVAADAYVIKRRGRTSIIAGYPWFTDWGRDAMICIPGLLLATGRSDEAFDVLTTFAEAEKDGLIPNRFPDRSETPEYHSVDAPLWFVYACYKYLQYTDDVAGIEALWPAVKAIITGYRQGTRFGIMVDGKGLIRAEAPGLQLTWMDAKAGDWVVTPRRGYPVEISALWYNALRCAASMGRGWDAEFCDACQEWAELTRRHFLPTFWLREKGYLADVISADGEIDSSLRPNQLFALSLPYALCHGETARRIVMEVWANLLTPLGLRSLSPQDAMYQPVYRGDQRSRDGAYHQGTVWAWLIGPFVSAYRNAFGRTKSTESVALNMISPLLDHVNEAGLGHVSEVFDGAPPHRPGGCFAQAWSVAELLRLWVEEFERKDLKEL